MSPRFLGKRQHLKQMPIKCDEVFFDQRISSIGVLIGEDSKDGADLVVAVVGEAISIGDEHQEHVEQQFMMIEAGPEAVAQEPVLYERETACDLSHSMRTERLFLVGHGRAPFICDSNVGPRP